MRQLAFTREFAEKLSLELETNLEHYKNGIFDLPDLQTEEQPFDHPEDLLESMLPFASSDIKGETAKVEMSAAILLFYAYKDLTPLQASYKPFWLYLSHVELYAYLCKRWPEICDNNLDDSARAKKIKDHLFNTQAIRNHLEGLYWTVRGSVQKDEDGKFDFSNTELLFKTVNVSSRAVAASSLFKNPVAVRGILKYIKDHLTDIYDHHFQARTSYSIQLLNQRGAVIELSLWSEEDFYNFLDQHKDQIKEQDND